MFYDMQSLVYRINLCHYFSLMAHRIEQLAEDMSMIVNDPVSIYLDLHVEMINRKP